MQDGQSCKKVPEMEFTCRSRSTEATSVTPATNLE